MNNTEKIINDPWDLVKKIKLKSNWISRRGKKECGRKNEEMWLKIYNT